MNSINTKNLHYKEAVEMNQQKLLETVFTKGAYKGIKSFVLCRETDPATLQKWVEALKTSGMLVRSADDLLAGMNWELEIKKWMEEADFVFALFDSKSAVQTGWFQKFVKIADNINNDQPYGRIKLLPIRLDTGALESRYPFQWLDVWLDDAPDMLSRALATGLKQRGKG